MSEQNKPQAVQTTGHSWDGDLQEYNNPLPRWWLWTFYATVVFAVIYWVLYPAFPIGDSWTKGVQTVEYTVNGEPVEFRWNTRARLMHELQSSAPAQRQQQYMEKVADASFEDILEDPEMMAFTRSVGKVLFADNCAACHGRGGQGVVGLFPNLADDDWLWGGKPENIHATLVNGRNGYMPAFAPTFDEQQLDDVTNYVMTLSGLAEPNESSARGEELFQGEGGGCYYCHKKDGSGRQSVGAANLTDAIWTVAKVPELDTQAAKKDAIMGVIRDGIMGNRVMPGWEQRLTETDIKLLTVYTHQLGGGQ